ncbi:MAG: diguanylate cyclase [Candidatus Omnitrophota bacterium]
MFEESWVYKTVVILALCILLAWIYFTNEDTILNILNGRFEFDTSTVAQYGIFFILSIVLFFLLQSTLDYKSQNEVLKKYLQRLQQEVDIEREALKELKSDSNAELLRLESFIVTISDMATQISSVLDVKQLLRVLLRKAIDLLGSEKCAIFSVNIEGEKKLEFIDSVGYKKEMLKKLELKADEESGMLGMAAENGRFVSRRILSQDYSKKHILDNDSFDIEFCQPIVHGLGTLAVLCVSDVSKDFTHEQAMRLLSILSNFGAVAFTNTMLVDKIREQSVRDSLTWLYNHQYFQSKMDEFLIEAKRRRECLGFVILDLDHFKEFNDNYGHLAGDFVLKKTAEILTSELRGSDITARYGGEEFVAVLPSRNAQQSYDIAERIRKVFEKRRFDFEGKDLNVTVSAGVSAFNPALNEDTKKNSLIEQADEALYKAKREGRNRVTIYEG